MSTLRAFQALCKVAAAAGALTPMTQNFGTTEEQIKRVYGPNNPVVQPGAKNGYKRAPKRSVAKSEPNSRVSKFDGYQLSPNAPEEQLQRQVDWINQTGQPIPKNLR